MPRRNSLRLKDFIEDDPSESKTRACASTRVYHCCERCASKRQARHLPQEMFPNILLHLPPQGFHGAMRHFRREWKLMNRTQSRIHDDLQNSTDGIIIQERCSPRNGFYMEMRQGCLEISKFDCGLGDIVCSSCNGLVLAPDCRDTRTLSVCNPLTKQRAVLPPCPSRIGCYSEFSLAFVKASMEYKVVKTGGIDPFGVEPRIAVLTIGVDKVWRHIDIQHLSLKSRRALNCRSFVTGGYIHWICIDFILTLNVESEAIRQLPLPRLPEGRLHFLPMGSNLSIFRESVKFFCDVWETNPETGESTMLPRIDLKPMDNRFEDLLRDYWRSIHPLAWLADGEVLVFTTSFHWRHCIAYHIKTKEVQTLELDSDAKQYNFQAHVKSLLWLERGLQVHRLRKSRGIPISKLSCT